MLLVAPSTNSSEATFGSTTGFGEPASDGLFASIFSGLGGDGEIAQEDLGELAEVLNSQDLSVGDKLSELQSKLAELYQQQGKALPPVSPEHKQSEQVLGLLTQLLGEGDGQLANQQASIGGVSLESLNDGLLTEQQQDNGWSVETMVEGELSSAMELELIDTSAEDNGEQVLTTNNQPLNLDSNEQLRHLLWQHLQQGELVQPDPEKKLADVALANDAVAELSKTELAGKHDELLANDSAIAKQQLVASDDPQLSEAGKAQSQLAVATPDNVVAEKPLSDALMQQVMGAPSHIHGTPSQASEAGVAADVGKKLATSSVTASSLVTQQAHSDATVESAEQQFASDETIDDAMTDLPLSRLTQASASTNTESNGVADKLAKPQAQADKIVAQSPSQTTVLSAEQAELELEVGQKSLSQTAVAPMQQTERKIGNPKDNELKNLSALQADLVSDNNADTDLELSSVNTRSAQVSSATASTAGNTDPHVTSPSLQTLSNTASPNASSATDAAKNEQLTQAQQLAQVQERMQVLQDKLAPMLGQRLMMMMDNKLQQAEIQLDPPELGSLMVRVQVQNDQAQVSMVAQSAQARDALEHALPRLREMLQQQQIELTQANISQQRQQGGQGGQDGQQQQTTQQQAQLDVGTDGQALADSQETQHVILKPGKVDFYA